MILNPTLISPVDTGGLPAVSHCRIVHGRRRYGISIKRVGDLVNIGA